MTDAYEGPAFQPGSDVDPQPYYYEAWLATQRRAEEDGRRMYDLKRTELQRRRDAQIAIRHGRCNGVELYNGIPIDIATGMAIDIDTGALMNLGDLI